MSDDITNSQYNFVHHCFRRLIMMYGSKMLRSLLLTSSLLILWILTSSVVEARKTSGNFVLNGVNSEVTIASFALSGYARGQMELSLSSGSVFYENERSLKLHLFTDTEWPKFKKATTCDKKVQYARNSHPINFVWLKDKNPKGEWQADVKIGMDNTQESRTHYWYVVITDCSLEYQYRDGTIPKIDFVVNLLNDVSGAYKKKPGRDPSVLLAKREELTHLSADQVGSVAIHYVTLFLSGLLGIFMTFVIIGRLRQTKSAHLALLLVMAAAFLDSSSSFCEIVHLKWYQSNGYGWYFMDALSSHFEAMCDSLISLVFLAIAAGWTMPSDVVQISSMGATQTWMQSLVAGLRNPAQAMSTLDNKAGILGVTIIVTHLILAQWGRIYNDDFDSYHDFEHLPGRILMFIRIFLGLIMVAAAIQTKSSCTASSLNNFYTALSIVGTVWFQGLPLITWICSWAVPAYLRHPSIENYGAICQSASIILLAWLVTSHSTSFHKASRVKEQNKDGGDAFTDSLSSTSQRNATTFLSFGKSKIRLD